jgi:hypothetical protein
MNKVTKNDNRRKNGRYRVPINLEYAPMNSDNPQYHAGEVIDISPEGISFESRSNHIEPEDIIMMKFMPLKYDSVYAIGDVRWKKQDSDKYLIGVRIRQLDKESRRKKLDFPLDLFAQKQYK